MEVMQRNLKTKINKMAEEKVTKEKKVKELSKEERIQKIKDKMEIDFGKGSIVGANDKSTYHEFISTGSIGLDRALGIGGLPKGRIIEIYGPESSGKTTLATHVIAEAMKTPDAYCAIIDVEHAFDTGYARNLGVDLDRLEISQPDYGEQALDIASRLIGSGEFAVVVVDSVAALVPKSELDGDMGDATMGKQARLMGQAMRKLTPLLKNGTIVIFINQLRDKIGQMMGNPETTTGGNALKFYASVRLDIRRSIAKDNLIKDKNDGLIGTPVKVKVVKNKVAAPFKVAEFEVLFGEGINKFGEVVDIAIDTDIIKKAGSWFSYDGNNIGQGRPSVMELLKDNPSLFQEIEQKVKASFVPKELSDEEKQKFLND